MNNRELFAVCCKNDGRGPREDIENYPDVPAAPGYAHTRYLAEQLIESAGNSIQGLPEIYFDFQSSPKVNAWATRFCGKYFIALTSGAMIMLNLVLNRMLANPKTFQHIGNPELEDSDVPHVDWGVVDAAYHFKAGVQLPTPRDEKRQEYAAYLADQALLFLIGHEIAHITRGHVDYLLAQTNAFQVSETSFHGDATGKMERQAIETDADAKSIVSRCDTALLAAVNQANQGLHPPWAEGPVPAWWWQYDAVVAVNILFRMFGDTLFSHVPLDQSPYPPLPLRRRMALNAAKGYLITQFDEAKNNAIDEVLSTAVAHSESAFAAIAAPGSEGGLKEAFSSSATDHVVRIGQTWNSMRDDLSRYAYEPIGGSLK